MNTEQVPEDKILNDIAKKYGMNNMSFDVHSHPLTLAFKAGAECRAKNNLVWKKIDIDTVMPEEFFLLDKPFDGKFSHYTAKYLLETGSTHYIPISELLTLPKE